MSTATLVRRARAALLAATVAGAALWGAVAGAAVVLSVMGADYGLALPVMLRRGTLPAMCVAAAACAALVLWRGRNARSLQRVALFMEDHQPALRFALVTAHSR